MKPGLATFMMCSALVGTVFGIGGCSGNAASAVGAGSGRGPGTCPVMGGRVGKTIFVDYAGRRIYFCCPACVDVFKRDPERYVGGAPEEQRKLE